jgi:hypothetical protein
MQDLQEIYDRITTELSSALHSKNHPFKNACLATVSPLGVPEARTLVMRAFRSNDYHLRFHSDYRSNKIKSLMNNPNIKILFYDQINKIQIILSALASVHYEDEITLNAWSETKKLYKLRYINPAPSSKIDQPSFNLRTKMTDQYMQEIESTGYKNFAVIACKFHQLEYLFLSCNGNQRALFSLEDNVLNMQWIAP